MLANGVQEYGPIARPPCGKYQTMWVQPGLEVTHDIHSNCRGAQCFAVVPCAKFQYKIDNFLTRFIAIQKCNALWEGIWCGLNAVSTTCARKAYTLYLCVGSNAPSLDILLFTINLMEVRARYKTRGKLLCPLKRKDSVLNNVQYAHV